MDLSSQPNSSRETVLSIDGLCTVLQTEDGPIRPVAEVSLELRQGEILGLVGESGSGKTMTALSVLGLLPGGVRHSVSGRVLLKGRELLTLPRKKLRRLIGEKTAIVFQNPGTSLNPSFTIGNQLAEALRLRGWRGRQKIFEQCVNLLKSVRIKDAARHLDSYPWELSGGMQQRVMLALALTGEPALLVADEPTTALDVVVQKRIISLMAELARSRRLAIWLITHDLGVVCELCDQVAVMYAGRIVEQGPVALLMDQPLHPYTRGLLDSVRRLEQGAGDRPLAAIPGQAPDLARLPSGCSFRDRCSLAQEVCSLSFPDPQTLSGRMVRCHLLG